MPGPPGDAARTSPRWAAFAEVCRRHGLALVYLFGSRAGDAARLLAGEQVEVDDPLADVDVGVVTMRPLPGPAERLEFYASLYNDLVDFFAPYHLDLVLLEENHSVFQAEALKGICVFEADPARREAYEMRILARAADFRPFLDLFYKEVLEEL